MKMSEQERLLRALAQVEQAQRLVHKPAPTAAAMVQIELLLDEVVDALRHAMGIRRWPEPTVEPPDLDTLEEWFLDSICEATDGCIVEHDGTCSHGHPSWFLRLGLI